MGAVVVSDHSIDHLAWTSSTHLDILVEEVQRLAGTVAGAVELGSTAPQLWDLAVIASCRLDGSAMDATPPPGEVTRLVADDATTDDVMRREYAGVATALRADDLAILLRRDPLRALPALHRALTIGLVGATSAGQLRRSHQAVHDGAEGRIVFRPAAPADIATQLPFLQDLVAVRDHHPVVVAGLLQFELLRLHPFESANGRLARVAARMVLREAGLDPAGLAVAEIPMSTRPVGNYDVAAAGLRGNDLGVWLETWTEDVVAGLRLAIAALGMEPDDVDAAGLHGLSRRFTLVELRDALGASGRPATTNADTAPHAGADREPGTEWDAGLWQARRVAGRLADAGHVHVVTASRGLRWTRGGPALPTWHRSHRHPDRRSDLQVAADAGANPGHIHEVVTNESP